MKFILVSFLVFKPLYAEGLKETDTNEMSHEVNSKILQRDKQLHFLVGAGLSKTIAVSSSSMLAGFFITTSVGALKELADKRGKGIADINDFIATSLGALLVLLVK